MHIYIDSIDSISYKRRVRAIPSGEESVSQTKDFVTIRLDQGLKEELSKAAELEQRSLSNFGRLLLEYAWAMYLEAGSMRELIVRRERASQRSGD
jgi:two-component SAPR family response regulator